ncbi:MAG: cytochrome C oxidase subunit IV family protein [candidate division KSB1 bacterium]|nr:cytochrome C oxidase subunit IV family protein [candidate division KSB1 bacterium]MDZ7367667.1 cytochrome C oxidase subunit IV family protein [candidate division KSB1 bacterium]MDZ7404818.1 cytochrome C oxidase subunit IV family protein [candidate division KSB1 bacterium]
MSNTAHIRPNYVAVWAWLVFLLVISLAAVYLPFSQAVTITLIFAVAAVKAFLVAVNFMHLKFEQRLVHLIALVPVVLFIIMTVTLIPDIVYNR